MGQIVGWQIMPLVAQVIDGALQIGARLAKLNLAGKYAGRSPNTTAHNRIVSLRAGGC